MPTSYCKDLHVINWVVARGGGGGGGVVAS